MILFKHYPNATKFCVRPGNKTQRLPKILVIFGYTRKLLKFMEVSFTN